MPTLETIWLDRTHTCVNLNFVETKVAKNFDKVNGVQELKSAYIKLYSKPITYYPTIFCINFKQCQILLIRRLQSMFRNIMNCI